jgi:cobalt-zinc-cadmium efflux system protein
MHTHFAGHSDDQPQITSRLRFAAGLTLAFVILEFCGGLYSHSLSVLGDAAQNFVDAIVLLLVWWSQRMSRRPADSLRTFGYHRTNILVALLNSVFIGVVVIDIAYQAVLRFIHPGVVNGTIIGAAGLLGLVCNIVVALTLRSNADKLHVRGAYLHTISDVLASALLLIAGIAIRMTGAAWIDLVLAAGICTAITATMIPVARKAVHILLEGTPDGVDPREIVKAIRQFPNVTQVHDLHAWTHADGMAAITCHVCVRQHVPHDQDHLLVEEIRKLLSERFGLTHSTIQIEHSTCEQSQKCVWSNSASTHNHA